MAQLYKIEWVKLLQKSFMRLTPVLDDHFWQTSSGQKDIVDHQIQLIQYVQLDFNGQIKIKS